MDSYLQLRNYNRILGIFLKSFINILDLKILLIVVKPQM